MRESKQSGTQILKKKRGIEGHEKGEFWQQPAEKERVSPETYISLSG